MSVRIDGEVIHLEGHCAVGDAEPLLLALQDNPDGRVEVGECLSLHMAVAQLLVIARPTLNGSPENGFLRDLLLPAIARGSET
jgi:hypothetical protein